MTHSPVFSHAETPSLKPAGEGGTAAAGSDPSLPASGAPAAWDLQSFLDAATVGLHCVAADGTILWANRAEMELLGYPPGEYIGQPIARFHADPHAVEEILLRLMRHEVLQDYEARLMARDGSIRHVLIDSSGVWDGDRFLHTRCFTRDITERKRAEEAAEESRAQLEIRYRHLQEIYNVAEMVNRADSVDEINQRAVAALTEAAGADRAAVLLFDASGVMRFAASRGISEQYRRAVEGHSPWARDAKDPQPVLVPDVAHEPALVSLRDVITGEGIRAVAFIPLLHQRQLLGKFMLYYDRPHHFKPEEVQLTQTIASHVGFALGRRHLEERLSLYRQIFANSTDGIAVVDAQGRYLEQNAAHAAMVGYSDDDLAGKTPSIHLGDETFTDIARELQATGRYYGEVRSNPKGGGVIDIALSAFALYDAEGRQVSYVGMKRDITARRRQEDVQRFLAGTGAALGASLDYRKALEDLAQIAVPFLGDWCAVGVVDHGGTIRRIALAHQDPERTDWARQADDNRVVAPDSPYGMAVAIRTGRPVIHGDVEEMLRKMPPDARQPRLIRILGACSILSVPLQARGRILGAISLFSTESARRYSEADLPLVEEFARRASLAADNARLYGEVQTATAAKDEFLSHVSHELRTPLTGIYGAVRIMRSRGDQLALDDRAELLDVLEKESDRMRQLVEDLLILSRLELGQQPVLEPVMAQRLIEKVLGALPPMRSNRPVEMEVQAGLPPIAAEPQFFEQVLRNLLNNADKYSSGNSPITVRAASKPGGDIEISVLDRGVGLSHEEIERIFEPFYRSPGTARTRGGMGIGLTVCKRLTEAQNGHIWARPREGGGAEIGFTLRPYREAEEA